MASFFPDTVSKSLQCNYQITIPYLLHCENICDSHKSEIQQVMNPQN